MMRRISSYWYVLLVLPILPILYVATLAHSPLFGDPTEYTFVANSLGVAHPPGYAFITIVGKLFQTIIFWGTISWRTHLIGATFGALGAFCVAGIIDAQRTTSRYTTAVALFGLLLVGSATNYWQHAIHANPHIITSFFLALQCCLLSYWYFSPSRDARWLYLFAFVVGLGVTHHPLTVFALPACVAFVLSVRPKLLLEWKTLSIGMVCALLGLSIWLYFPLRAPALVGTQFVHDMNTADGFLNVVLARGLTVNLFHFGLGDQRDRLTVFLTLLQQQYSLPILFLTIIGIGSLAVKHWRLLILYLGSLLLLYGFVINTVQDVMAYLLAPFLLVGSLAALGLLGLLQGLESSRPALRSPRLALMLIASMILFGPLLQIVRNAPRVSLRDFNEGNAYRSAVHTQFDGSQENAVLLNDWEHATPLWYGELVEGDDFAEADVRPIFVSAAKPWITHIYEQLPAHPVYLSRFERTIFEAGFRLRTRGLLQQVVQPGDTTIPKELTLLPASSAEKIEWVGYDLPKRQVKAGDFIPLTLAMRATSAVSDAYVPVLSVGELQLPFTTDSHLLTTSWITDEVIVEAFPFALPYDLPSGEYPLSVRFENLSGDSEIKNSADLGMLQVESFPHPPHTGSLRANYRQRVGLRTATVNYDKSYHAPWREPIYAHQGDTIHLTLEWEALARPEDSYTVFVHLIDKSNRPIIDYLDYTPLGGASPTHLWFPKWLPGQRLRDPYTIKLVSKTQSADGTTLSADVPPGEYLLEVGLYEQFTRRRLHIYDVQGNIIGDRYLMGEIIIQPR